MSSHPTKSFGEARVISAVGHESAVITAVSGVDAEGKGPASGITYDISYHTGSASTVIVGVTPCNGRLPDTVNTVAAKPGSPAVPVRVGGNLCFIVPELPYIQPCP